MALVPFYTPLRQKKTFGFLLFTEGRERVRGHEID